MEMHASTLDKNTQDDGNLHSNDQNKEDASKNFGVINKDKAGFTPPPIFKSILKNVARKTQVGNSGKYPTNSESNEVLHDDTSGVHTQSASPKMTVPLR